jgi:serine/threonine protein kinase
LVQLAQALRYLHAAQLLHCDVKADNVLLRSDPAQPLGWAVKLSDFGVSKLLREGGAVINRSCSGTLSHLAPELFQVREGGRDMMHGFVAWRVK